MGLGSSDGLTGESSRGWSAQLGRVAAISPHLDDAVLSAGGLLDQVAHAVVFTIFAGPPDPLPNLTEWDEDCGFVAGADVVGLRREEDRRALQRLGATAHWLDFLDSQYSDSRPSASDIAVELAALLEAGQYDTIAFPLGIDHEDHVLTHDACALLLSRSDLATNWVTWADVPYRVRSPELLRERIDSLRVQGFDLEREAVVPDHQKTAAVKEYPSQIKGLGASTDDAWQPEEFYVLTR
jgi:LmbE family N-acetylglucosaminyl deacetylase